MTIQSAIDRFLGIPAYLPRQLRSNIFHYYLDIGWWGLYAGATMSFLSIYATRIGATPTQIGLLSALPAAISLVLSLPSAGLVRRMGAHRATWVSALLARLLLLPYALLPSWLDRAEQVWAILAVATLMSLPNTVIGISFSQLLMEAIPLEWRGMVVGVRNACFSIITFAVTVLSGRILTGLAFPLGYQVVFVIGFVGGVATAYHLYKVRPLVWESQKEIVHREGGALPSVTSHLRKRPSLFRLDASGHRYLRVLVILFCFNLTNNMVGPLTPGVLVNTIHLSDAWISVGVAANSLIVFVISLLIARLIRRLGNRGGTALGASLLAVQSVTLALARGPAVYLLSVAFGGIGSGILSTAQFNYHLENVPEGDRAAWLSWSLLLGNAALLVGSLAGPWVAAFSGAAMALAIFSAMRLLTAVIIFRWG